MGKYQFLIQRKNFHLKWNFKWNFKWKEQSKIALIPSKKGLGLWERTFQYPYGKVSIPDSVFFITRLS